MLIPRPSTRVQIQCFFFFFFETESHSVTQAGLQWTGNTANKAPAFIRIEKITPQGDTGAGAALQRDTDGDGPGAPTAVSEGEIISAADFGKLSWNTAHNDGGSFRFVALDANQKPILGASAQIITVSESPAAPDYPTAREPLAVAHDQTLALSQDLFAGNTANKAPAFIRIEKIAPQGDTGSGAALQRDADGDGPGAPTAGVPRKRQTVLPASLRLRAFPASASCPPARPKSRAFRGESSPSRLRRDPSLGLNLRSL